MTWLAPWALAAGALGMMGVIAAHLLARQRPRALSLATARFLPAGMLEATALQRVPTDRWWMLLRLVIVALLALGAAQPIVTGSRVQARTVLLLDRTLPVAEQRRVLGTLAPTDAVIAFDSSAAIASAATSSSVTARTASLSAALARLTRVHDSLAAGATQLRVQVASSFADRAFDPATETLRSQVPDSIAVVPVTLPSDSGVTRGAVTVHADANDPIAATAQLLGDSAVLSGAIVERGDTLSAADSTAASAGATVLWWPAKADSSDLPLNAATVGSTTWIAPMGRDSLAVPRGARAIAWWADGTVAATARDVGRGCVLEMRASLPVSGDQTLSLGAQAFLATILAVCDRQAVVVSPAPRWLAPAPLRTAVIESEHATPTSTLAPWLVGAALALAAAELLLRLRSRS
jgi:hypothetical protein